MIKQYCSLFLFILISTMSIASAADDPMESLFLFQHKMAKNGSSSAMMKTGEMYERGEGTVKSYDNALDMYQKAKKAGHAGADEAIQRLKKSTNKPKKNISTNKAQQKKILAKENIKKKQAQARTAAVKAKEEAARLKAEKEKSVAQRNKAKLKKATEARRKAKFKAEKEARIKAAKFRAKLAKEKFEKDKANKLKAARAKAAAARVRAAEKRKEQEQKEKGAFKSDPCKGKAARLLSICR